MTKPVTIPNTFATATTAIPLSQLDSDFSAVATALNDANTYSNYATDTGVANAYVVTLTGVSTTYSAGLRIQFKAGASNTGASTLNVNGGGTKNITFQDASALSSGTIAANSIVDVMYDGTQFLLMNDPAGATGGDVVGPASATDNAIVRFDGATGKLVQNSVVTIADSTGDISGVGQLNATTLDATNIEVTNIKAKDGTAAASIADSTGVISVTANPILSGGTANGVLYLNGSKVATSGSALTFDGAGVLTVGSDAVATVFNAPGDVAQYVVDSNGTGATASHQWKYGSTEAMRLTSTGLGIGTSSPTGTLEVAGVAVAGSASSGTSGSLVLRSRENIDYTRLSIGTLRSSGACYFGRAVEPSTTVADGFNGGYTGTVGGGAWTIYDDGSTRYLGLPSGAMTKGSAVTLTERIRIDSSGNVGIGTSSPAAKLQVTTGATGVQALFSNGSGTPTIAVGASSTTYNTQIGYNVTSEYGYIQATAATGVYDNIAINPSGGNVGIGTSSPTAKLSVDGSAVFNESGADVDFRVESDTNTHALFVEATNSNVKIGGSAERATTVGTNHLDIFNGTAPVGTLTNGISIYSSSGEAYVMDAAGNATLFSPHDRETNEWIFHSKHTPTGKVLRIDVERLLKFVNDHFGLDAVQEFIEP